MSVLQALNSVIMTSIIYECPRSLKELSMSSHITLQWIKERRRSSHDDEDGLTRCSEADATGPNPTAFLPCQWPRSTIHKGTETNHNYKWTALTSYRQAPKAIPALNASLFQTLIPLKAIRASNSGSCFNGSWSI